MPITSTQMNNFVKIYNPNYQGKYLDAGIDLGAMLLAEGNKNRIRADIALCVCMIETVNLTANEYFTTKNPGGIGGDAGVSLHTFADWLTGTRALIQHLFAYGVRTGNPADPIVDPRYSFVTRGIATTVDRLTGRWSDRYDFGDRVKSKLIEFHQYLNPTASVNLT